MKKLGICALIIAALAACEPNKGNMEDLNNIPEEVENVAPEV